jgi:hypothetical protein
MNIDSILTEWCYRLPKGYPAHVRDYEVLYHVLLETADVSPEYARQIVERAKGEMTHLISESLELNSVENQLVKRAIVDAGKEKEFQQFLKLLPTEADMLTLKFLENLSLEEATEFAQFLYTDTAISEQLLDTTNYKTGIGGQLFNLEPKGMGKGEIFLAALVRAAQAQGGGKSYDMLSNGQTYEIKNYSNPKKKSSSIRLGTKGTVTRFKFWNEITMTFQRLSQLRGIESPKFDLDKLLPESMLDAIRYLENRKEFILAGNLNLTDKRYLDQFYAEAHEINSEIQGYTNVILRGPNAIPIEMSIEPITDASGEAFVIRPIKDESQSLTYINTELRRLKYVRNPLELDRDMQDAVNEVVGNELIFIIFRADRVNVTRDFRYAVIDAGRIRIIEKDVTPEDVPVTPEPDEFED